MGSQPPRRQPAPPDGPDAAQVDTETEAPSPEGRTIPRQRETVTETSPPSSDGVWVQDGPVRVGLRHSREPAHGVTPGVAYQLLVEVRSDSGIPGTPESGSDWLVPPGAVVATTARSGNPGPQLRIFLTAAAAELRAAMEAGRPLGPVLEMLATRAGEGWLR